MGRQRGAPNRTKFVVLDAVEDPLPYADLVVVRDVLQHLHLRDAQLLLNNVRSLGGWILISNGDDVESNVPAQVGETLVADGKEFTVPRLTRNYLVTQAFNLGLFPFLMRPRRVLQDKSL